MGDLFFFNLNYLFAILHINYSSIKNKIHKKMNWNVFYIKSLSMTILLLALRNKMFDSLKNVYPLQCQNTFYWFHDLSLLLSFLILESESAMGKEGWKGKGKVNTSQKRSCFQIQVHIVQARWCWARQITQVPLL